MTRPVLEVFTVRPFEENTYLLGDAESGEAIVMDPGGRVDDILRVAELRGLKIREIVNTHAHVDHVLGVAELKAITGAPFRLHPAARPMLAELPEQARRFGLPVAPPPEVDGDLAAGEVVEVGGLRLVVKDTPGHAPGHVSFVAEPFELDGLTAPRSWVGDLIFLGSIGRFDLPGGDYETLLRSIDREVMTLSDDTVLYAGHGPATTVGHERAYNPYVRDWRTGQSVWA
jgi:glyoxylase-like metal-dependent hydrolase (beta-lactamase superfamily II)